MKQIVACGISDAIWKRLEASGEYRLIRLGKEAHERGEVRLARLWQKEKQSPDLVLVGYPGAAGLAACDFLYGRSNAPPILWLCDREEFEPEAGRMGIAFFHIGRMEQERLGRLVSVIRSMLEGS